MRNASWRWSPQRGRHPYQRVPFVSVRVAIREHSGGLATAIRLGGSAAEIGDPRQSPYLGPYNLH